MSCNTCQAKFSFFTKEIGCPSCDFSHCNKCLKYKYNISNIGTKKICGRCYNKFNKMKESNLEAATNDTVIPEKSLAPVDITMKLNSLENPVKPPIVMYKHMNHWDKFKKGLEPVDQQIVDRLRKLKYKERNIPLPSVEEIRKRLALLKDQDPEASGSSIGKNIYQTDTRTDQEKTDDLIQEYLAQLELSSKNDPCKEIQERLTSLQDGRDKTHSIKTKKEEIDDDEEEEAITKKLVSKAIAEVMLEEKYETEQLEDAEVMDLEVSYKDENEDDKSTCVMCEQTVDLVKCAGCANDLYCPVCFEDNHDDFEMQKHKPIRFKPTKISSD